MNDQSEAPAFQPSAHPLSWIRALAIEGGGIKGLAYPRVLERLAEYLPKHLSSLERLIGTSAGAITAMIIALGADTRYLARLLADTPWQEFFDGDFGVVRDLARLVEEHGYYRLDFARDWLADRAAELGWRPGVTFAELWENTGRQLEVVAINETRHVLEYFNYQSHPDVPIVDATLASMAIPFVFPPVEIDGEYYSDGGVAANLAMSRLDDCELHTVMGIRLAGAEESRRQWERPATVVHRAIALAGITMELANQAQIPHRYRSRVMTIETGTISALDFRLDPEQVEQLQNEADRAFDEFERSAQGIEV